jgi:hypothetical protein
MATASDKTDTKKAAMLEALEKSLGIVTTACNNVGISRQTHYEWMRNDSEYSKKVNELLNVSLDFAESQLLQQIKTGNTTAIIFYLKTQGKTRGYVERQEIETSGGSLFQVEIIDTNKDQ